MLGLPALRPGERGRVAFFATLGALVTLAQTVGLAGAEALFLARLGAARLPLAFVLAALAAVAASLLYAVRVGRARNDRVLVELLAAGTLGVAAAWLAVARGSEAALTVLFCLFYAGQAVLLSHFWTFAGDFFDTLGAKRVVPLFTLGMSAGGALGGGCALLVLARQPAETLLAVWALGLVAAAALVLGVRGRLPHWRALGVGEQDETSVAGLRAALRHLRRSRLGRGLVAAAVAMVLALFVAQYLYSELVARAIPDEAELARFLAVYLAASNLVEIAIELVVTPLAIRRLGVPSANLLHPLLTLLSFALLVLDPRLPAAVAARANRELLESALAGPMRNLVYNALPARLRSRVRALLEGIVVYAGMAVAGVVLLAVGALELRWLAAGGAACAGLYALATVRVRRAYVGAISAELRAGRLDLAEMRAELGAHELAGLAEPWARMVRDEAEPAPVLLELAPLLVAHGFADPVREAARHPSPRLRAACLEALAVEPEPDPAVWLAGLADPEPGVRRAALRSLPTVLRDDPRLASALARLRDDPDPRVRAEAARADGTLEQLVAMLGAPAAEPVLAALDALPEVPGAGLAAAVAARLDDADPRVRASALEVLARTPSAAATLDAAAERALADPVARVRRASVYALARCPGAPAAERLAAALRDPAREVRSAAVAALAARGSEAVAPAAAALRAPEELAVEGALAVLGRVDRGEGRAALRADYAVRVRNAWEALLLARAFAHASGLHAGFLHAASADALARALRLAFLALAALEDPRVVRSVERTLRLAGRGRADAFEVLSHLGERSASQALVTLLEPAPFEEKAVALRGLGLPPDSIEEARTRAVAVASPWASLAVGDQEHAMRTLLSLRRVSLFAQLSLERLAAIERITTGSDYVDGEVIVREGELGDDLFLLVEGEVDVSKGAGTPDATHLSRLGPGSYFGEIAILDGSPRSATVVAASDVRVIVLAGERLRELLHDMPELGFDLLRVLATRVRRAEDQLTREAAV